MRRQDRGGIPEGAGSVELTGVARLATIVASLGSLELPAAYHLASRNSIALIAAVPRIAARRIAVISSTRVGRPVLEALDGGAVGTRGSPTCTLRLSIVGGGERVAQPKDESVRTRPLRPEDAEELGDLFDELAADPEARHFHPHPLTRAEAKRIAARSGIRDDLYFAAFIKGRLAGYGMLRGWDEGYVIPSFGVAVGVGYRGAGVGRTLLRYAISAARRRGARSVILKVHPSNASAWHIYESEGFTFYSAPVDGGQIRGTLPL